MGFLGGDGDCLFAGRSSLCNVSLSPASRERLPLLEEDDDGCEGDESSGGEGERLLVGRKLTSNVSTWVKDRFGEVLLRIGEI